ncbi:nuclear transport factor 2 family protein [Aquabacterium sp.]|uniref:nuclear transport factor 2 family protein n=1 Tax=Aquabacterium sp. TaxID=1872578 RepID=UPI001987C24D|nr:nuclear transport factor 2 family protein [Aquabacterium sp.]MBC7700391.1 nuclear transport factor 2 family protein [Aquabacterium sp.]
MPVLQYPAKPAPAVVGLPRLVDFFEHLGPHDLPRLSEVYAPDAHFKDPFNDVRGLLAIEAIFAHMFRAMASPRFVVLSQMAGGDQAFLVWDLRFQFQGQQAWHTLHGATHVTFDAHGRVLDHRDYWDAAEELYEKLPLLGGFMRWLKRRVAKG